MKNPVLVPNQKHTLYFSVGISGSGKTHFLGKHFSSDLIISTDQIRQELTGNVDDQSKNKQVFEIAEYRLRKLLLKGSAVFDATNLHLDFLRQTIQFVEPQHIRGFIFPMDLQVSQQRIQEDLRKGKIRSAVPDQILNLQAQQYQIMIEKLKLITEDIHFIGD